MVEARRKTDTHGVSCGKNTEIKAVVVSCYGYLRVYVSLHENRISKVTMLCATLRRRRRSLDSLEDYRLLAPSHRCSSCGRKYSRSKQILSKVRKLISQTGTVLVADWLVDRVVCINRTYHLFVCCCVIVVFVLSLSVKNPLFWQKLADVSEDCCTALKMKVATSSEKSINFYSGTRCLVHNIAVFKPGP